MSTTSLSATDVIRNGMPQQPAKDPEIYGDGLKPIKSKMKFRTVMLTPRMAKEFLRHNHPRNRNKKWGRVEQYAADMKCGVWRLTPIPVAFCEDGWLINGQNTCEACESAGVEVPITLVTGVPRDAIIAMDCGVSRNVRDAAKISGRNWKGSVTYAAINRAIMIGTGANRNLSIQEQLAHADAHEKALDFVFEVMPQNTKHLCQACVKAVIARAYYQKKDHGRIKEFVNVLITGLPTHTQQDSGALRLRNWLLETLSRGVRGSSKARPHQQQIYARAEQALKAFIEKRPVEKLHESKEELFQIPGES